MSLLLKAGDTIRTAPGALIRVPVKRRHVVESPAVPMHGAPKPAAGRRNTTIDVLRGYCILMMITSHTSTQSYVNNGVHLLRFVSGAEGFVFLAGLVLGIVYRRKLDAAPAADSYRAILKRAGLLWTVHCALTLTAVILNPILFHYADIPDVSQISPLRALWLTGTLQPTILPIVEHLARIATSASATAFFWEAICASNAPFCVRSSVASSLA